MPKRLDWGRSFAGLVATAHARVTACLARAAARRARRGARLTRLIASRAIAVAAFLLLLATMPLAPAAAVQPAGFWVADELLVGFDPAVAETDRDDLYRPLGAARLEVLARTRVHRVRVPAAALEAIERALARRPGVQFVERNRLHPPAISPADPYYASQWHLPKIAAPTAWDISQGAPGVVIAILDTGVDPSHPDLAAKLVPGYNVWDRNTNTQDVDGHGTAVAGTAAALGNNGIGVAGVAWQNAIMPIRVTGLDGWATTSTIVNGLVWAVDHGARVMNVSFGSVAGSSAITQAAQYVVSRGGVVVAAAGNCGCWETTPDNPYIISVSATDSADQLASWSSRGNYVDVSAPGAGILTTARGGGYASVSGTSFASPITAGVVALMMAVNPTLGPAELEARLLAAADDRGTVGWDALFGTGRVNAYRALAAAGSGSGAGPSGPDTTAPTVSIATLQWSGPSLSVSVLATDDVGVVRVDLYLDGRLAASDRQPPYSFLGDTAALAPGPHTLLARAYDGAGNVGTSSPVSFTARDDPGVSAGLTMTGPADGSELQPGGSVTFTWTALPGAVQYGVEFTGPDRQFANPNGTAPDPVNGFGGAGGGVLVTGTSLSVVLPPTLPPASYQVRVIGLTAAGEPAGGFSDALTIVIR